MPARTLERRNFLKLFATTPLALTAKAEILQAVTFPDDYYITFDLVKPCDMYYDEIEKDRDHFCLEIYDATNKCDYEGYIAWWILASEGTPLEKAWARGYTQSIRGLVRVVLKP